MIQPIKFHSETISDIDYSAINASTFVNIDEVIKQQPIAISIGKHEYKGNRYPTPIASYGDFFCLVGASKSRKTFAKKAIIASYIGGNASDYFPDIAGHDNENKIVIDNDTEQSLFHTQQGARQVLEMVGYKYGGYYPYSMRSLDVEQRIGLIKWQLKNIKNIGLMFIDGIADLVKNVNDIEECNAVVQLLMSWSKEYKIAIGTVLHMNYGTLKATGHLGSSVTKKAETVISVVTEDYTTTLSAQYTRNRAFYDIAFNLDNNSLPIQTEVKNKKNGNY
jgi:hypothetical protein